MTSFNRRRQDMLKARKRAKSYLEYGIKGNSKSINSQCLNKKVYVTYKHAQEIADKSMASRKKPIFVYQCNICFFYHLTHVDNGKR